MAMKVKDMKALLDDNQIDHSGCCEKKELIQLLKDNNLLPESSNADALLASTIPTQTYDFGSIKVAETPSRSRMESSSYDLDDVKGTLNFDEQFTTTPIQEGNELNMAPMEQSFSILLEKLCTFATPDSLASSSDGRQYQMYLSNLEQMQANLILLIPQYIDNEKVLMNLMNLKEAIDATLQLYQSRNINVHNNNNTSKNIQIPNSNNNNNSNSRNNNSTSYNNNARMFSNSPKEELKFPKNKKSKAEELSDNETGSDMQLCTICDEECYLDALPCGHEFCLACIREYLVQNMRLGKVLDLTCPSMDCDYFINEDDVATYLDAEQLKHYQDFLVLATIRADPNVRNCPTPDCKGALPKVATSPNSPPFPHTKCEICKKEWCWECLRAYHPKQSCKEYEDCLRAQQLLSGEDEIRAYMQKEKAQPCPRCKVPILKKEGCNHMRCASCGENFCWICGKTGIFEGHFTIPGRCFGKLMYDENEPAAEGVGRVAEIILLPITLPVLGGLSLIESMRAAKARRKRKHDGESFTLLVIGEPGTGKSTLIQTYLRDPTQKGPTFNKTVTVDGVPIKLQLVEIGDASKWKDNSVVANADGFILLYDCRNRQTLEACLSLYSSLKPQFARQGVPGILVGSNKDAKKKLKQVKSSDAELKQARDKLHLDYKEVNATGYFSVRGTFKKVIQSMLKRWEPVVEPIIQEE